jgi:ketosteroid isomerase-like protein
VSHALAFPDTRIEVTRVLADDGGATMEFVARGTHTGPLLTPDGTLEPTGRSAEVHYCFVYEIEDGQIHCIHQYFDAASMMRQLRNER